MSSVAEEQPLLQVQGLCKSFRLDGGRVLRACEDVSFDVMPATTFGIIGESGSGKTTLGRCLLRLMDTTSGSIRLSGVDITRLPAKQMRPVRQRIRIVFQEPALSMNPRLTVGYQIAEPLRIHGELGRAQRKARVGELLGMVGLPKRFVDAHPGALSGGELQRCSIARALASNPALIVLDEPTSALPPGTRREVIDLLLRLQAELGVAYVFISHDLSLVRRFCSEVAVMYLGRVVEQGRTEQIFQSTGHPYTAALLAAQLSTDPLVRARRDTAARLRGEIPSAIDLPTGCPLAGRCPFVVDRCRVEEQRLMLTPAGHLAACWRVADGEIDVAGGSSPSGALAAPPSVGHGGSLPFALDPS